MKWLRVTLVASVASVAMAQQVPQAGAGGMPVNRPGGISHVTRPTPQIQAGAAAASLFGASGVPLNPPTPMNGASAGATAAAVAARPAGPEGVSRQLQALAASGDPRARAALNALRVMPQRPATGRANLR
ncbi:MAG: hypothetical protein J0L84_17365 [Verrucomicrobia bacterium]|nr:hypothetical protein [Verrucomicrobiota bacterium]